VINKPTVLILGAGASYQYGFPLGSELRKDILSLSNVQNPILSNSGIVHHGDMGDFCHYFKNSRIASIDAFLAVRPEFAETGKKAIAAFILNYESTLKANLLEGKIEGWYDYLWNELASGVPWKELSFANLSIITFNYDRSLETFLISAIQATYRVSIIQAAEKLAELKIVHVYGDVGPASPLMQGYSTYGIPITPDLVNLAVPRLKVIPEARDDEEAFIEARTLLEKADSIGILGFGFDSLNLKRLNAKITCATSISRGVHGIFGRTVIASCIGQTIAEATANALSCGFESHQISSQKLPSGFINGDCLKTLRETLILR
jgi:hypothetical protein